MSILSATAALILASSVCTAQTPKVSPTPKASPLRIILDPGHGGEDLGAHRGKFQEKEIVLKVALQLNKVLKADPRFEVFMTRSKDETVPLQTRSHLAHERHGDIFVSIHTNSTPTNNTAKGAEFYFLNQYASDEESQFLAARENEAVEKTATKPASKSSGDLGNILDDLARNDHIQMSSRLSQDLLDAFEKELKIRIRAIRQAPFHVLSASDMPATLVELGFISTPSEAEWMAKTENQKRLAKALYDGLQKFKEKLDKKRAPAIK